MRHHSTFRLGSSDRCLLLIFLFLSNPALCVEAQKHFTEVLPVFSHLLSFALFLQLAYNIWTSPSCSPLLRAAVPRHKELRRWAQALPSAITGLCLQNHVLEIEARPPHEAVPVSAGPLILLAGVCLFLQIHLGLSTPCTRPYLVFSGRITV